MRNARTHWRTWITESASLIFRMNAPKRNERPHRGRRPLERVPLEQEAAEEDREDEGDHRADERVGGDAGQDPEPPRRGEVEGLEGPRSEEHTAELQSRL